MRKLFILTLLVVLLVALTSVGFAAKKVVPEGFEVQVKKLILVSSDGKEIPIFNSSGAQTVSLSNPNSVAVIASRPVPLPDGTYVGVKVTFVNNYILRYNGVTFEKYEDDIAGQPVAKGAVVETPLMPFATPVAIKQGETRNFSLSFDVNNVLEDDELGNPNSITLNGTILPTVQVN